RFREYRGSFLWFTKATLKGNLPSIMPNPGLSSLLEKTLLLHSHCMNLYLQTEDPELRKECRAIERFLTSKTTDFVRRTLETCSLNDATDFYNMVRGSRSVPDDVKD
ncbi:MAG: hypothetical protein KDB18_14355, partial [Salinibacterium sp.]|nr:hypothetical protein [Salinibacterium sp.]